MKILSRKLIFLKIFQIGKGISSVLKTCIKGIAIYPKGIAIYKNANAIVKEREKNAEKLTTKNVIRDQKYHEKLQISKTLHTQSKIQGKIFKLAKFCNKRIILKSSKQRLTFLS